MVLRMKTLIFWGFTEKSHFQGRFVRKINIEGGLLKKGAWTVCRFKGGELGKNEGWCF